MDAMTSTGERLPADVQGRRIPEDALGLWWRGQVSFIVRGAGMTVYVDPYLNPTQRRIGPPCRDRGVTSPPRGSRGLES